MADDLPDGEPVAHGYTITDVKRLARVCGNNAFSRALGYADRRDAAMFGITAALLEAAEPPSQRELLDAGQAAIRRAGDEETESHGYDRHNGGGMRARYAVYWLSPATTTITSFEDAIVERVAVWQIWASLSYDQQQALWALAIKDDHEQAALWCGLTLGAYRSRLARGRRIFRELWYYPEQDPGFWGRDRRRESDGRRRRVTVMQRRRHNEYIAGWKARKAAAGE